MQVRKPYRLPGWTKNSSCYSAAVGDRTRHTILCCESWCCKMSPSTDPARRAAEAAVEAPTNAGRPPHEGSTQAARGQHRMQQHWRDGGDGRAGGPTDHPRLPTPNPRHPRSLWSLICSDLDHWLVVTLITDLWPWLLTGTDRELRAFCDGRRVGDRRSSFGSQTTKKSRGSHRTRVNPRVVKSKEMVDDSGDDSNETRDEKENCGGGEKGGESPKTKRARKEDGSGTKKSSKKKKVK